MKKLFYPFLFGIIVLLSLGMAHVQKIKVKIPTEIPGLDKIVKQEPVLTTTIADAVTEAPFLDDFSLERAEPLLVLPRTPDGGFILNRPGNYVFEYQSYCLQPGSCAPAGSRGGDGYLYAPFKGPQSDIIRHVLRRSYLHPEIPQEDIQVLLWAILARTRIKDMSPSLRLAAAKLLTPEEIFRVNGGALGLIPGGLLDKAWKGLPPAVQRMREAEARLREMLTAAAASYEELERVAVLQGEPPFEEGDRRVPVGRWSFHPDGYFIRYFPHDYWRMLIELYVSEPVKIERDSFGRIASISVSGEKLEGLSDKFPQIPFDCELETSRLKIIYENAVTPAVFPGETSLQGHIIKSLRFETLNLKKDQDEDKATIEKEWTSPGWLFSGIPSGGGEIGSASERFPDFQERYEMALIHKTEVTDLNRGVGALSAGREITQDDLKEIMDLGHCAMAVQKIIGSDNSDREHWMLDPVQLVKMAWQSSVSKHMSTPQGPAVFNPADDPVPGKGGSQREGGSGRPSSPVNTCLDNYERCRDKADRDLDNRLYLCSQKIEDMTAFLECLTAAHGRHIRDKALCKSEVSACVEAATRDR